MPRRISIPPPLGQFLGAYFNEDWSLDHETWQEVVDSYIASEPPDLVTSAAEELKALLETEDDDSQLERRLLREFGCYFNTASVGLTPRTWLREVLGVLQQRSGGAA